MAELKILSAGAVKRGVEQMIDAYSRNQGTSLSVDFVAAPKLRERIEAGEEVDLVVAPVSLMDDFVKAGRITAGSRALVGRSRMGVVIHQRALTKELSDVDSLKRLLTTATAVVHNKASSGLYAAKLLESLGLKQTLGNRIVVVDSGALVMEYVAKQEPGAVGLAQISEIRVMCDKGLPIRMLGPLPDAVQNVTSYEAAAISGRANEAAAKSLASFLGTDEAKAVFAATGID